MRHFRGRRKWMNCQIKKKKKEKKKRLWPKRFFFPSLKRDFEIILDV